MTDNLVKRLRKEAMDAFGEGMREFTNSYTLRGDIHDEAADRIEELEDENEKLHKALDVYQRERDRFRHTHPEITGEYFLAGGYGERDSNQLPEFVEIVPAYGCGWSQVYQKVERTISYEGS